MRSPGLTQVRLGYKKIIAVSRSKISVSRQPMTTDPNDESKTVIDPTGTASTVVLACRLPHEVSTVPDTSETPAGLSTNLQRMIMFDWKNVPLEGDTFTWKDKGFEIGAIDPLYFGNDIYGYQATLKEA